MDEVHSKISEIIKPVYLVGGKVRDNILGRENDDWDFTTPLTPDEIEAAFRETGRKVWTAGKKFGTIASKVQLNDGTFVKVEVTTFREEQYTKDNRKPTVQFVEHIEQDLARRDFTINAMALRGDRLIDPFNGKDSLLAGIIRAVGNPKERFNEDPLRILRAARFASVLGFEIEERTSAKMKDRAHKILTISKERIMMEMDKILMSPMPSVGLDILMQTGVMVYIIPELTLQNNYNQNNPHHNLELWEHTLTVVDAVPADINMAWAALLHDIGKPFMRDDTREYSRYIKHDMVSAEITKRLADTMKWSNDRTEKVFALVNGHMSEQSPLKPYDRLGK